MAKNQFDDEFGGFIPSRVFRTKYKQESSMGRGPKRKNDDIRGNTVGSTPAVVKSAKPGPSGVHPKNKQYTTGKVKNSSPNYVQRKTSASGGLVKC